MKRIFFTLSTIFCAALSTAQTGTKIHTVLKGETITQIAKKYNTTKNVLFLLNPESIEGISENQIIKIPIGSVIQHQVQVKETVYGISKQYNIAIDKLYDLNPGLKENGLKVGQYVNLTEKEVTNSVKALQDKNAATTSSTSAIIVEKGDTVYGLAVKYNTTVSVLNELNPGLIDTGLKIGQPVNIPMSIVNKNTKKDNNKTKPRTIVVQPKQTIYNIAKANNVSQEQLLEWNPDLKNGLKEGATLIVGYKFEKIPYQESLAPQPSQLSKGVSKNSIDLSLANDGSTIDLVMLLPFNISSNNFNNPSINQNIKEDVFLNMTLDFYSGAKLAIDHLSAANYNLNIKFVDSKETNRALDVHSLKNDFDFKDTDVIIGPFFQKNVDAVSEVFKNQQTIIVSPLSTEKGKPYPRQVHTMPNADIVKKEMLEYLISKEERVIAITDGKRTTPEYFSVNYPSITPIAIKNDEKISVTTLKNLFSPTNVNYVVYDATSLTTTVELMNTLKTLQRDFKIQLVTLDKLDILESSDVEISDLVALKYTYPSVTNDSYNTKKSKFVKEYRLVYGKNPSRFATRGYDVTYDVITRMFESDENSNIFDYGSQQIENKFTYINENGGVYNNAVYILYYDKDLTIKEAK